MDKNELVFVGEQNVYVFRDYLEEHRKWMEELFSPAGLVALFPSLSRDKKPNKSKKAG